MVPAARTRVKGLGARVAAGRCAVGAMRDLGAGLRQASQWAIRGVVRPLVSRPGDSSRVLMMAVNRGGRELRRGGGPAERPRGRPGGREGPQWLGVRADIRRRGHAAPARRPSPFKGEKKNPLTHRVRGDKGGARLAGGRSGGRGRDRDASGPGAPGAGTAGGDREGASSGARTLRLGGVGDVWVLR